MSVTVVTALRAESRYVEHFAAAAESVLSQEDLSEWQLVYDVDSSTDSSAERISQWLVEEWGVTLSDDRVVASVSVGGASAARHRGVLQSSNEFFVNLDGDDLLTEGALGRIEASLSSGARFGLSNTYEISDAQVLSDGVLFREEGHEFFDELHDRRWLRRCWLEVLPEYTNPARLTTLHADRSAYLQAGGYSPMPRCEEMLLLRNLDERGGLRILGEPTHGYRKHGNSVTSRPGDELGDVQWELLWR